ncbi:hypothetical protein EKO04_000678 [Ascochyta lentis]|uniref:Uncharacterized protein n=1 Tax=Ascochyta lentis TaxID=205686 RepID=A0A8H7JDP0_9PLEO|nr:hypothetical protein EKO04_000678 [Ascochyta lentis]
MPISVSFMSKSMYTASKKQLQKKAHLVSLIQAFRNIPATAARAVVISGLHTSRSDRRMHATVDFFDDKDRSLGRKHIVQDEDIEDGKQDDKSK